MSGWSRSAFEKDDAEPAHGEPSDQDASGDLPEFRVFREQMEARYIQDLMARTGNEVKEACTLSGLSKSRLYELLKKHRVVLDA